jgi:hypothetical protein
MNSPGLPAELLSLIQSLYAPSAPLEPAQIHDCQAALSAAQDRPEAWQWAAIALADVRAAMYIRFYGAVTLSHKVSHDLASLTDDDRMQLQASVLAWMAQSAHVAFEEDLARERIVARKLASSVRVLRLPCGLS